MPEVMRVRLTQTIIDAPRGEEYPVFVPKGSIGEVMDFQPGPRRQYVTVMFGAALVGPGHGQIGTCSVEAWQIDVDPHHLEFVDTTDSRD
jgi:hypothetical protein